MSSASPGPSRSPPGRPVNSKPAEQRFLTCPVDTATTAYSAAIAVAVGDIVQNTGRYGVLVCAQATASGAMRGNPPNKGVRISTAATFSVPPGYRRTAEVRRPKLDPFIPIIEGWLADRSMPRKQRHTATHRGVTIAQPDARETLDLLRVYSRLEAFAGDALLASLWQGTAASSGVSLAMLDAQAALGRQRGGPDGQLCRRSLGDRDTNPADADAGPTRFRR
ncbi:hypothetical protein [Paracoccus mutanolyticus]|uniref:hypothetical protein n=1 Tax=Paracoccus mutanolyticus TaxID=1499308 RepID=UPI00167715CC|nr:hypothetical protein [Paracoccus mutanolyticus]